MKITIISGAYKSNPTQALMRAGEKRGHEMSVLDPAQTFLLVSERGFDRLYDGYDKQGVKRIHIKDIDALIPRIGRQTEYALAILEHLTSNMGIWSSQSAYGISCARDKLKATQLCSAAGLPTPKTIYAHSPKHVDTLIKKLGGLPVIAKMLVGSQGTGVSVLETSATARSVIETYFKSGAPFLLQEFIECDGRDIRALVLGDEVVASMERKAVRNDFRSNLSLGGAAVPIELTEQEQELCIAAARAVGLVVAGVDLIRDKSGKPFIVEVNSNFGFKIERVTGVDLAEKMIEFVEANHNKDLLPSPTGNLELMESMRALQVASKALEERYADLERSVEKVVNDAYLQSIFDQTQGKQLRYRGRDGEIRVAEVQRPSDLHQVLLNCLVLK